MNGIINLMSNNPYGGGLGTTNARMNEQSKNDSLACLPAYNMVERWFKSALSQGAERSSEYPVEYREGEGVGSGGAIFKTGAVRRILV